MSKNIANGCVVAELQPSEKIDNWSFSMDFDGFIQKMVDFVPKLSPNSWFDGINYVNLQSNSEPVSLNLFGCGFLLLKK